MNTVNGRAPNVTSPNFEARSYVSLTEGEVLTGVRYVDSLASLAPTELAESVSASSYFPLPLELSRRVETALRLLGEAKISVQSAVSMDRASDYVGADDSIYSVKSILPELFLCRSIGDGFGSLVGALISAFENKGGQRFTSYQMRAVADCIAGLDHEPFLGAEAADDLVQRLEDADLDPNPDGLRDLIRAMTSDKEDDV